MRSTLDGAELDVRQATDGQHFCVSAHWVCANDVVKPQLLHLMAVSQVPSKELRISSSHEVALELLREISLLLCMGQFVKFHCSHATSQS